MNVPGVIDDVIKNNAMIELTNEKLANFATNFLAYYKEYIISAHFDENQNLVVVARPELDFQTVVAYLTVSILDTVNFDEHIDVHLYEYGTGEFIEIGIN